ncbi:ATP-binding protein, partial [Streptomyces nojiriensis]|uniref:ATP-binding protein n=1 Tax=Streptomyces nojiriensis TaxID=66374 RepID=UPI00364D21FD
MQTIGPDTGGPVRDARGPAFPQLRRLALRDAFRQVARGRQFTREALEDWGWDGQDTAEDAVLVVSELVTNAKLHAGGCHELMLRAGDVFRVEVYDGRGEFPRPLPALRPGRPGRPGGHCAVSTFTDTPGTSRRSSPKRRRGERSNSHRTET